MTRREVKELILRKDRETLIAVIADTDIFLANNALRYKLWDTFLPVFTEPDSEEIPIDLITQLEKDTNRSFNRIKSNMYVLIHII